MSITGSSSSGVRPRGSDTVAVFVELAEVDSTNAEALRRAAAGERGPLWIRARRQTAGRGRSGRDWLSVDGNLLATLLISPRCPPLALHQLALVVAVAVFDAAGEALEAAGRSAASVLRLKWPNDVLAGADKLGGILIESTSTGRGLVAAIGIGLNVAVAPEVDRRKSACMAALGAQVSAAEMNEIIDRHLRRWLEVWQDGAGFDAIRNAWLARSGTIGEPISVNTGRETVNGVFAGLDETGALLVDSVRGQSTEMRRFTFGDVSLMLPKSEGSGQL